MNRRCVPVKANHDLLTPDTHTRLGVRLCPVAHMRLEAVTSLQHWSESPNSQSAVRKNQRPRPPVTSLPRRLRFEDESETEAETRYLERLQQRTAAGWRGTRVLVSKPDPNFYFEGSAGAPGAGLVCQGQASGCGTLRTVSGGGVSSNLRLSTPVHEELARRLHRPRLKVRTEPIRETYIGSVTYTEPDTGAGKTGHVTRNKMWTGAALAEFNEIHVPTISRAAPTTDLPKNPYALRQLATPPEISGGAALPAFTFKPTSTAPTMTTVMMSQSFEHSSTKVRENQNLNPDPNQDLNPDLNPDLNQDLNPDRNQSQEEQRKLTELHSQPSLGAGLKGRSRCEEEKRKSSASGETTAELQEPRPSEKQPMRAEHQVDFTPSPDQKVFSFMNRHEPARLSLRQLFASLSLKKTRATSLDRLTSTRFSQPFTPCTETSAAGLKTSSSLQTKTSGLQTGTSDLQTKTSGLQTKTSSLKTKTSGLQTRTSDLQTKTSDLQTKSSGLQTGTSVLQTKTSGLQTKFSPLLRESPSLQPLSVEEKPNNEGAPLFPLRKTSSIQSLRSEKKKKKKDRSSDYKPAADQCAQGCFGLDDVGSPSSVRSVGRVLEVCSDGKFLLELNRPDDQMFGFFISRGRAGAGVYVDDMVDCGTMKLYSGLLAVGDEILEVKGQRVAGLSLDQVTELLTQEKTITIRVQRQQ